MRLGSFRFAVMPALSAVMFVFSVAATADAAVLATSGSCYMGTYQRPDGAYTTQWYLFVIDEKNGLYVGISKDGAKRTTVKVPLDTKGGEVLFPTPLGEATMRTTSLSWIGDKGGNTQTSAVSPCPRDVVARMTSEAATAPVIMKTRVANAISDAEALSDGTYYGSYAYNNCNLSLHNNCSGTIQLTIRGNGQIADVTTTKTDGRYSGTRLSYSGLSIEHDNLTSVIHYSGQWEQCVLYIVSLKGHPSGGRFKDEGGSGSAPLTWR
ncbi:MAG: hypothetical protein HQL37_08055 [Alphaproteobacteria bacterium]|nr:hypothetical protein [Alphaproteobacteria bacterium]